MDLNLSADEIAFRDGLRAFIAANLPAEWRGVSDVSSRVDDAITRQWLDRLAPQGYLTAGWPAEFGGVAKWTPMQQHIFRSELARARAPEVPMMEFGMVAPLVILFGSDEQKARFLPRILSGEDRWGQGFSEPQAGSDLASLRTAARREGDEYVVNGQKIWTTYAHKATMLFCLVRTDPDAVRPHAGISMLFIPTDTPGITVRPIYTIEGSHHFNEVFFDDVRVPASARLGEENKGWDYARALLSFERFGAAALQTTQELLAQLGELIGEEDPLRLELAALEAEADALEMYELRTFEGAERGIETGIEPSILKVVGSELRQRSLRLGEDGLGAYAEIRAGDGAPVHPSGIGRHFGTDSLFFRAASIYGGANEVQRNIIAKALLRGTGV